MTYLKQKFSIALNGNLGPKDILHMDILPNILPSEGFNIILTAIDVFSRKLFAYPTNRITSPAVASVIRDILCKHSCLPTAIITDMGTQFNSQVTREEAAVLGVELKHTSTKHAQTALKMQPNLSEEMKINYFHSHLRGLAFKLFENIQRMPATTLEDILVVFCRK